MGIPAAFRWLSTKYPKIISPVIEDKPIVMEDGTVIPVDTTRPNPNGEEFDNLYLDMNGIVHPCSHPEDKPAPKDEEEMMLEIFKYTDRVVNMVRPRKLLMIAIDGVAPRAKMNQQRSRRFRAAQEAKEKQADKEELLKMLKQQNGGVLPPETLASLTQKAFDSNSITPGTPFMDILAISLRYWCAYKLNTDPGWANMKVIISDATVPGEGEHKIMNFVRSQRTSPDHDPNTRHVIYGLDADLIMLGLATHEPHFRVLREDVFFQEGKARTCKICGQKGHDAQSCRGETKQKDGEFDEKDKPLQQKPFIWLHVSVLREYLAVELEVPGLPFRWDLERAIDDWVFMCFFVGNDFLPHLPALEIRENGIDTLTAIWRDNLTFMGGYMTKDGHVDLERAQYILDGLGKQEDAIFRRRKEVEDRREASFKRRKLQEQQRNGQNFSQGGKGYGDVPENALPGGLPKALTHDMVVNRSTTVPNANTANKSAAAVLKSQIQGLMSTPNKPETESPESQTPPSGAAKRKASMMEADGTTTPASETASSDEPEDNVRLWEDGYADRYYESKFHVDIKDLEFRQKVAWAYTEGLAWVLRYYFQGCPSWEWFYPYHYAPFAQDFKELAKLEIKFEKGRIARPFEQLMSVQPAGSRHVLPDVFHPLMTDEDSPIIDFYPEDFVVDLNGKKMAWQGVALLPFIEMPRLLAAIEEKYPLLTADDAARNEPGREYLLLSEANQELYDDIIAHFYSKTQGEPKHGLDARISRGLSGKIEKMPDYLPHGTLEYPLERKEMPDVDDDRSLTIYYDMPSSSHTHKSMLLRGVRLPPPALNNSDIEELKGKARNSGRSYRGAPLGRQHHDGRRERMNYGPDSRRDGNYRPPSQYNNGGRHGGPNAFPGPPMIPPGWAPPPPGVAGFGSGLPPPPPPAYHGGGRGGYGNSRGGSHGGYGGKGYNQRYAPPEMPPYQNYGGQHNGGYSGPPRQNRQHYDDGRSQHGHRGHFGSSLPHRTATPSSELKNDDIATITRASIVNLSATSIALILDPLVSLLEDLARPFKNPASRASHIAQSESYILALGADCCSAHWQALRNSASGESATGPPSPSPLNTPVLPAPLEDKLVKRVFSHLIRFVDPIPDGYVIPAKAVLEDDFVREILDPRYDEPARSLASSSGSDTARDTIGSRDSHDDADEIEPYVRVICEFVSAANWSASFDYVRYAIRSKRATAPAQTSSAHSLPLAEEDRALLVIIKLLSSLWVDAQKLSLVLQELSSTFLHLARTYQNTVALVAPLLILKWIERYPHEFVRLHSQRRKLDGAPDTLADMTQSLGDNGRRRSSLYPFQTTLLMLVPEVFEVASNLRDAKGGNMAKRAAFLEGLRKGLRNKNETAGVCLVILLRAARHFPSTSESAFLSWVMDIQDELKDAVFRRHPTVGESIYFEQDLTTTALISLTELNIAACAGSLAQLCAHSSAPLSFKVAIMQTCSYFARKPNAQDYHRLYVAVAGFIQHMLKAMSAVSTDLYIGARRSRPRPSASDARTANEIVICNILNFLSASPLSLFESASPEAKTDSFYEEIYESFVSCLVTANDTVRTLSRPLAKSILPTNGLLASVRRATPLDSDSFKLKFWKLTSSVLMDMCDKYLQQEDAAILKSINSYLESGLLLLSSCRELCRLAEDFPERTAVAVKAESLLLLALCSPEIETLPIVTSALGLLNEECLILLRESQDNVATLQLPNYNIFAEISSPAFRFTGMMAFQKRTRALLRRITYPSPSIVDAWLRAFEKWTHLSKDVSTAPVDSVDERAFSEWRNLSGFLASLGGVCTADQVYGGLEDSALSGLKWIDRVISDEFEVSVLERYLRQSTQLLACSNVRVRETIREVLSTDISPPLYQPLFKALEAELESLFKGNLASDKDREIIFAEQAASLLRTLVEKLESPSELGAAACLDLSSIGLEFVKFLDGVSGNTASLRVKIKVCQFCESVTRKKEHLNFRDDVRKRNQLLEYIFSWIARPGSPKFDSQRAMARQQDEATQLQRDLDKACFRCLASLTYRLPLQPGDGQTDAGTSELKSQMFDTYFNRFLSLLNHDSAENPRGDALLHDEAGSTSALAITILSNLLSANIDVGLKHSLSIGYHENIDIRTAFVKVLYNILVQGTEFSSLSDKAVNEKYNALLQLLTQDMSLVTAISMACPSGEVEELTVALLNIFETRGLTFQLMEALIKQEVEDTVNEAEILRRNCVATKMLSIYAKWKGSQYLKLTLQKVLERLMQTSQDLDLELDPSRLSSPDELTRNVVQIRIVAQVFIDDIVESTINMPPSFRKICHIISSNVKARFPESRYVAVGSFLFLRFFCPAIVAPESEKLVSETPSKEMRRGLLLIAKIIQQLANNAPFGTKEQYMYPLDEFMYTNIVRVLQFQRELSVRSVPIPLVLYFGSCVVLHRFLYEHRDNVRQRLLSQQRREQVRTPSSELSRGRAPALDVLPALVTTLGPPSLAMTWNRPQISLNCFTTYSRFQHFMLRNAFRDTGSFMATRAIYDGGETKDGLSIIFIILRHIDRDSVDHDSLLFAYFKIASRLWHKPFGIFIDASCDNGSTDFYDDIMRKLELLTPAEASNQLSRCYIYNMNSTYRKTFRRNMRVAGKRDTNLFEKLKIEIHLLGTIQELWSHFNIENARFPKEIPSAANDARHVFAPVTRLSKTKGKIEVVIKVGTQFVQVTTVRKQEVHPTYCLNAIINDIFRLGDVDEAPTPFPTEDDSAFGLRADNGKIVMYFQSPKKNDILQFIRAAKAKYGKDTRTVKSFERLVRPQDIPGALLNLALMNLAAPDQVLRIASYNLLGALCQAFEFKAASKFLCINDIHIPMDANQFIVNISKTLAQEEPQLTVDFLNEFFIGWDNFSDEQKPLSLAYMAPWLPGLRTSVLSDESDSERGKEKIATIFQKLIDSAVMDTSLSLALEHTVWPAIYTDEILLDIFLEEIIKATLATGPYDDQIQALTTAITAIGTITLRGKVISRLRKALNRSVLRPTRNLPENAVWNEICVLLQFCLALSFDCGVQSQLYMPEIFHVVTMLANTGPADVRSSVQRLLLNSLHAACTSFKLDDRRLTELRSILDVVSDPKHDKFSISTIPSQDLSSAAVVHDMTEQLAILLFDTCTVAAPSVDLANSWRSRWMSLVASTAFQNNPAIQPRAFIVMGCLAREEIDDDLLYQVLVALRHSITRFGDDGSTDMLVAVVTSLSKMIAKLASASRYGLQLFWLSISLIRLMPTTRLFTCAIQLLEAVLANISISNELRSENMASFLLQGRSTLEEATIPLDEVYGVHFTPDNFHFAVCASLVRGLSEPGTTVPTLRVVSTFLELTTSRFVTKKTKIPSSVFYQSPYMTLIQSRVLDPEQLKGCLWSVGINSSGVANFTLDRTIRHAENVQDQDLLLHTAIQLVDFHSLGDDIQAHILVWLNDLARERPAVILPLCSAIASLLDEILIHAQNPTAMKAAHELLQSVTSNPKFAAARDDHEALTDVLEDIGFEGLWRPNPFLQPREPDKQLIGLTEKLIELIIM
ncbi:hypothetical protein F4777DRAFT_586841 [Nemania sp. FL0916]|nr:hypothetical protein F4777DRAFT_586841 [Nemania sp. FL0916]